MRELLPALEHWLAKGEPVAIATVISTWGSAPRPAGSYMAVSHSGGISGSVSGGCVEGAVVQAAGEVIKSGKPQRLHFGVTDEEAWEVGLTCGGKIDIFVQPAEKKIFDEILPRLKADGGMVLSTVVGGEGKIGAQALADESGKPIVETIGGRHPVDGRAQAKPADALHAPANGPQSAAQRRAPHRAAIVAQFKRDVAAPASCHRDFEAAISDRLHAR